MTDEIIKELWSVKDTIASDHGYDLTKLVNYLRSTADSTKYNVVDLQGTTTEAEQEN